MGNIGVTSFVIVVNIVKELFESKSQLFGGFALIWNIVVNIVKELFESKSQREVAAAIMVVDCCKYCQRTF